MDSKLKLLSQYGNPNIKHYWKYLSSNKKNSYEQLNKPRAQQQEPSAAKNYLTHTHTHK